MINITYVAGLFDGEGCVQIRKLRKNDRYGGVCHLLATQIANTNLSILELLKADFGGCICEGNKLDSRHKKRCWTWSIASHQAYGFLKKIYPYLIIKKAEVDIAFEFQEGLNGRKPYSMTSIELERREYCKERLSLLKKMIS